MTDSLTLDLDPDDLPAPGEDVVIRRGPFEVLIAHTGEPTGDADDVEDAGIAPDPGTITYSVVDVHGATRTHAAIVRQRAQRSRVDRFPLCSRSQTRKVSGRRRDLDLQVVTCTQCRRRLEAEGII